MMKPSLLHLRSLPDSKGSSPRKSERRRKPRASRLRALRETTLRAVEPPGEPVVRDQRASGRPAEEFRPLERSDLDRNDAAHARARSAPGPDDLASYSCQCGYVFLAAVSTTVACPHCRSEQAW